MKKIIDKFYYLNGSSEYRTRESNIQIKINIRKLGAERIPKKDCENDEFQIIAWKCSI